MVTHTPAKGHCDTATKDDRAGCAKLVERLADVRPKMHVSGHIHEARGGERVMWSSPSTNEHHSLVESMEYWSDPAAGNKKISLLDVSARSGRALENKTTALPRHVLPSALKGRFGGGESEEDVAQPGALESNPTSSPSLEDGALVRDANNEADEALALALWRRKAGGAIESRSDVGCCGEVDADTLAMQEQSCLHAKVETVMINVALLGPRIAGKGMVFNKPIVVDIELPVWRFSDVQ